jgi:hypothetical protein
VTTNVVRTLFREYGEHRTTERGNEETGWVLLGRRLGAEAVVLATLPAGADREAGEAHVMFNEHAQAVASQIVRQSDRRITMLGVVHTHPGSLRHPSDGDYRGDIEWVGQLRGGEGVFGIGTADGKFASGSAELWQPRENIQAHGELSFTWYSLRQKARNYLPVTVDIIDGPDLADPLRLVWPILEKHSDRLELLARQLAKVNFEIHQDGDHATFAVTVPMADGRRALQARLSATEIRYYVLRDGQSLATELHEPLIDRGLYRLLADLTGND